MKHLLQITRLLPLLLAVSFSAAQEAQPDSLVPSPFPSSSQSPTLDQKIDRLSTDVTEVKKDVRVIRDETVESRLGNRKWGVEVSPFGLLFLDQGGALSGTVSNFSWDRSAEIAFPFYYAADAESYGTTVFNLDAQYRRFLSDRQRGFYISGFTRFQHGSYQSSNYYTYTDERRTINRLGIGAGIGGRIFSRSGFYWGWNISYGRFLVGDKIRGSGMPDSFFMLTEDLILDVELVKIGFAF